MKKYILNITGTHCTSCKILIEDILQKIDFIKNVEVDLKKEILELEVNTNQDIEDMILILNNKIKSNGYSLSLKKIIKKKENNNILLISIPIGLFFLFAFFVLQKSGFLNIGIGGGITPVTSFLVGIVASFSSCLAIVGGLVLSLSAKFTKDGGGSIKKSFLIFHIGRLLSFALLGGLLGYIGEIVGINFLFSAILGLMASLVMIILGLNLIGFIKKNKITLPSNIFNFFRKTENTMWAPLLIGFGTFFLPCGFTQSMQISALSSGSFVSGFLIMLSFSLGTLPILASLSFGSISFSKSKYAPFFFKIVGVIVFGLGVFAFLSGLAGIGIINPLFNL